MKRSLKVNKKKLLNGVKTKKYKQMSDEAYLKMQFALSMKKDLDLENPKTFNEKLQWLKLYNRDPLYTQLVDKYRVREYVKKTIGEDYLIPLYGVYDNYQEIDFEALPNQFVLKMNHTSGGVYVIEDKDKINHEQLEQEVNEWLATNYYWQHREWPYKDVEPKIIVEKLMVDEQNDDLKDYKFLTFAGEVKLFYIASSQPQGRRIDYYDLEFNPLAIEQKFPKSKKEHQKPKNFEKMIELAAKLAADIPHVRVDLYEINGKVYFGEMTFYSQAGIEPFEPESFDKKMGDWLQLPGM